MPIFDNVGGGYRQVGKSYSNIGGGYREDSKVYDNVGGGWRETHSGAVSYYRTADSTDRYKRFIFNEPLEVHEGDKFGYEWTCGSSGTAWGAVSFVGIPNKEYWSWDSGDDKISHYSNSFAFGTNGFITEVSINGGRHGTTSSSMSTNLELTINGHRSGNLGASGEIQI